MTHSAIIYVAALQFAGLSSPEPAATLPEPIARLADELAAGRAEFLRNWEKASSDDTKEKLRARERERVGLLARRALDLAASHPGDGLDLAARTRVVKGGLGSYLETEQAFRLLAQQHIADPKLVPAVEIAFVYSQMRAAEQLLQSAREKSPHRDVRGQASYGLALCAERRGRGQAKEHPDVSARETATAERLLEEVVKDYGDIRTRSHLGTLGADARALLFRMRNLVVGKSAPDFVCTDPSGRPVKLSELRGRVVVLDFWYTGCGPCRAQFPHLRKLTERHAGKPFSLIGITEDEDRGVWLAFLEKERLPWVQWYSGPGGVVSAWGVNTFPTLYVLDSTGVIRFRNPVGDALDQAVDALLTEMESHRVGP
jgi:peroxiredoxin